MIKYFMILLMLTCLTTLSNANDSAFASKEVNADIVKSIALSTPEEINKYINNGQDVNLKDFKGNTILQLAINDSEYPEVVEALIGAGADVNAANSEGHTSLMIAVKQANNYEYNISQMINDPEFDTVDIQNIIQDNNLKNIQNVKQLLNAGAEINLSSEDGTTPLMYAVSNHSNNEIVKLMIENQVSINQINDIGENALIYAVKYSDKPEDTVRILINGGIDINRQDKKGNSAYNYALKRNILSEETLNLIIPSQTINQ